MVKYLICFCKFVSERNQIEHSCKPLPTQYTTDQLILKHLSLNSSAPVNPAPSYLDQLVSPPPNPAVMKVASFNIQKFGKRKLSNPNTLATLVKIVSRYDIIVILEVVDERGTSVKKFLEELNKANKKQQYTLQISTRLGRDKYKEQFMFLYRDDLVDLVGSWQYEDNQAGDVDAFAREPYILRFKCLNSVLEDLVLIPVHTKPEDSGKELDELYDVFLEVTKKWKTDNVMILGDFNADGSYLSKKGMKAIRIRSDKNFHWLIKDDVDTTANTGNDNTYDRIVIYGDDMLDAIVPNSAKPFNFQIAYGLSEEDALKVSDHYPVEVELKRSTPTKQSSATGK
ncbi:deoxyribonuclease-1 isoform X2 [Salmo trutta]|uniref:deoxyribonuclease-1 isoform X2 n=1 Tax=Salmo trutta TaxID=8032 RepID=UPI0011325C37|nr:deoxyribonuclease-1-like isoform X2 [Salmo trutta]